MLKLLLKRHATTAEALQDAASFLLTDPTCIRAYDDVDQKVLDSTLPVEERLNAFWIRQELRQIRREARELVERYILATLMLRLLMEKKFFSRALWISLWRIMLPRIITFSGALFLVGCILYTVHNVLNDRLVP